jgi:hypothetical protein
VAALIFLVGWIAALSAIGAGFLWARWLRRRAVAPRFAAWTSYALLAFATFAPFAMCARATVTVVRVNEQNKGELGTESVSVFSGPILLAAAAAILLAFLVLVGATWRWHWFPRSSAPRNDPPYR